MTSARRPPAVATGPVTDAVRRDPAASYDAALVAHPVGERERAVISAQLGRPARGAPAVVHRCAFGLPTVVRVAPFLEDGTPFPTTFWLTCPVARARVGTLEADHAMVGLNERLDTDDAFAADHTAADRRYRAFRAELGPRPPGDPSVGGMASHVKCLHVHVAHHLATGDNVIGSWALDAISPAPCPGPCVAADALEATDRGSPA